MKQRNLICLALVVFCLLLSCITVSAAQSGSLRVENVEGPVCLYHVADLEGTLTEEFRDAPVENLSDETNAVENSKILSQYISEHNLTGWEQTPDSLGNVHFSPLEENLYFVCSGAAEAEFTPFLMVIPTEINGTLIYDVYAAPKAETPTEPTEPTVPTEPEPEPEIPQTGANIWPKYALLAAGALIMVFGFIDLIRGRERKV